MKKDLKISIIFHFFSYVVALDYTNYHELPRLA